MYRSVKQAREVEVVDLPLPMPGPATTAREEPSAEDALADEGAENEDVDIYTPEALESTLDAAFRQAAAEEQIINACTGISVDGRSLSYTELLLCNDFDIDNVKFSPTWAADEVQVTPTPSRMGTSQGFNVDDLMAMGNV